MADNEYSSCPLLISCNCLDNHACEHINTLECTELVMAYTDLENQGVTNAGLMYWQTKSFSINMFKPVYRKTTIILHTGPLS